LLTFIGFTSTGKNKVEKQPIPPVNRNLLIDTIACHPSDQISELISQQNHCVRKTSEEAENETKSSNAARIIIPANGKVLKRLRWLQCSNGTLQSFAW